MPHLAPIEKKGLLMISIILLVGFVVQWMQPHFLQEELYNYSVEDSVFTALSADTIAVESPVLKTPESSPKAKTGIKKTHPLKLKINVNTASAKELEKLPRIGPATARNIILYRQENGHFKTIEELQKVKRIGPKTLLKIKPYIVLSDSLP